MRRLRRQQAGIDIPTLALFRDKRNGFFVVLDHGAGDFRSAGWLEAHPFTDIEFHHLRMRMNVIHQFQSFHDTTVETDQLLV